ncbi:MAG: energy-coupling factor transporter transmembrane component T [Raoultibacter sp.]
MAFSVAFGQYVAHKSAIHALDARAKIVLLICYTFALFACSEWLGIGICAALALAAYGIARIPLKLALRGLKPVIFIVVFTVLANAMIFDAAGGEGTIALIGSFGLSAEGALRGLFFACRIVLCIGMASLLTYTSSLVEIVDAIASLIAPLKRVKVPVEDIAVVCALTLRFVPSTMEEADRIMKAQAARGLSFDQGGLMKRAHAWVPVIIPLFVSLFGRAERLACAMDARCYTGVGRTRLAAPRRRRQTTLIGSLGALALIGIGIVL